MGIVAFGNYFVIALAAFSKISWTPEKFWYEQFKTINGPTESTGLIFLTAKYNPISDEIIPLNTYCMYIHTFFHERDDSNVQMSFL